MIRRSRSTGAEQGSTPIAVAKSELEEGRRIVREIICVARGLDDKRDVDADLAMVRSGANSLRPGQEKHMMRELEVQIANSG